MILVLVISVVEGSLGRPFSLQFSGCVIPVFGHIDSFLFLELQLSSQQKHFMVLTPIETYPEQLIAYLPGLSSSFGFTLAFFFFFNSIEVLTTSTLLILKFFEIIFLSLVPLCHY